MFFLQTLIFFDILCFKLNRRGFTELPFSIININFKLLIICISKIFLPLEGVEQFTYIPKHYFEQEWDFYCICILEKNHSIKSIITYNYRLGILTQLNISEVLIFFFTLFIHWILMKMHHFLLSGRHVCVIGFVHYIWCWRKLPPQIEEFSERESPNRGYRFNILSEMVNNFKRKWVF